MFEISKYGIVILLIVWIRVCAGSNEEKNSCHGAIARRGGKPFTDTKGKKWQVSLLGVVIRDGERIGMNTFIIMLVCWVGDVYRWKLSGWSKWSKPGWEAVTDDELKRKLNEASEQQPLTTVSTTKPTTTKNPTATTKPATTTKLTTASTDIPPATVLVRFVSTIAPVTTDKHHTTNQIMLSNNSIFLPTTVGTSKPPIPYFVPFNCPDSSHIGTFCNHSTRPCDSLTPCQNSGSCTNNFSLLHGYSCMCKPGFTGTDCESDIRLCKPNLCLHNGDCQGSDSTHLHCHCARGRTGIHCEFLINSCDNVTCFNRGICRPLLLDYKCECLFGSSGRHCEHMAKSLVIRKYVAKGFAYIAIIAMITTSGFIIVLDVLRYAFGIDPVRKERDQIRRRRALPKRNSREKEKPKHIFRPHYVSKVSSSSQLQ